MIVGLYLTWSCLKQGPLGLTSEFIVMLQYYFDADLHFKHQNRVLF